MSSEPGNQIISQLAENEKAQSVCIEVNECKDKIDKDEKDNKTSVVIRIEPAAAETVTNQQNTETETDSLNSNNPCEKHEDQSVSLTESENTTASVTSDDDDIGVANPAFVEDDEEKDGSKKKKGHQRRPSCSPNKDIESISGILGGSGKPENVIINPPILTGEDVLDSKDDKQYSEYFMPKTEIKTQLGDYKKNKKSPSVAKIFCWIMSCLLLTGAIIIAVLIGTGIIETDPNKNIKVSRKLLPEILDVEEGDSIKLLEVTHEDAPNVLTNDPQFFVQPKQDAKYFDAELRITNVEWNSDLEDKDSYRYQQLATILQTELDSLLNDYYTNFVFNSRVQQFIKGSVIVLFEISAQLKSDGSDVINSDNILDAIVDNLDKEFGYLFGKFIVPRGTVMIKEKQSEPAIYVVLEDITPEIDSLEQQLETYESEIFSKPRLEPISELITGDNTENTETPTTATLAEIITRIRALSHSDGIEFESTTSLADIDTINNNSVTTESNINTTLNVITTRMMMLESEDSDQLAVDIESRTDIYDQSEISDKTQSEYLETQTIINVNNIELEYFRSNDDDDIVETEEAAEEVTTDVNSLEINTINTNIDNS